LKLFFTILSLLSFNLISDDVLNTFNSFIKNDLLFSQETEINLNEITYSEGYIQHKDEIIEIFIDTPFKEKYTIENDKLIVFDFEFNQTQTFPISNNESVLINVLKLGAKLNQVKDLTDKSFKINFNKEFLYIELLSDNIFEITYKDNMNFNNVITLKTINS
tara:strand:+ start:42 stop:527 length:486 start_codon:yes stop_codon:yes gene_type:complete